jgi:hypothetical protein
LISCHLPISWIKIAVLPQLWRMNVSWVPVVHACNPSCSGGRDQEDCSSKPAQANHSWHPISNIPNKKKGCWTGSSDRVPVYQVQGPEFKFQYHKKRKNVSHALVTHSCDPGYLRGWNQEDHDSRPAQANSSWDPISKITRAKWTWRCGSSSRAPALQVWSPEFKPQYHQKKPKQTEKYLPNLQKHHS